MSQKSQISTVNRLATTAPVTALPAALISTKVTSLSSTIDEMVGYSSTAFHSTSYHELLENPHVEHDGLQRLQENLARLSDLHGRLQFLMRDISGLIRRR